MAARIGQGDSLPPGFTIEIMDNDPVNPTFDYYFEKPRKAPSRTGFSHIGELGNLYFFRYGTEPQDKANQVAYFPAGIIIRIDLNEVPDIVDYSTSSIEKLEIIAKGKLRLCYKEPKSRRWVFFERQYHNETQTTLEVKFNFWHDDPNVGWGFL